MESLRRVPEDALEQSAPGQEGGGEGGPGREEGGAPGPPGGTLHSIDLEYPRLPLTRRYGQLLNPADGFGLWPLGQKSAFDALLMPSKRFKNIKKTFYNLKNY